MTTPLFEDELEYITRDDGIRVFQRRAFCQSYFHYRAGEHVVFGGPTTNGKTSLAFDLMEYICTPMFPAYLAVSKPSDPVTAQRGEDLNFRRVPDWPPPRSIKEMFGGQKPNGYLVWPPFGDLNEDMLRCARITERLLMERYASGANPRKNRGGLLVMDDTMVKAKILGLDTHMVTILAMAGAMKYGLWIFVQKPTDSGRTTLWGYEQATHLFFTKGGDHRMLDRYVEIIGTDGRRAKEIIPTLDHYQFLYVHKVQGYMCIVDAAPERTSRGRH